MSQLHQFLAYHYGTVCRVCSAMIMDPDKRKNQQYYKGKCPECGKDSKEETKKEKKKNKKNKQKQEDRTCRAKY